MNTTARPAILLTQPPEPAATGKDSAAGRPCPASASVPGPRWPGTTWWESRRPCGRLRRR